MLSRLRSAVTGFAGMRQDGDLKNSNIEESKRQPSKRFQATVTDKSEEKQVVTEEHLAERILPTDPSDQSKRPLANDFKKNQKPRNAQKPDITADAVIAVMGLTGTGKSSFINLLTGGAVRVGHGLEACTADVGMYGFKATDGRSIALIDTPGFDDTYRSDTEVLHDVAYFLGQIYEQKVNLAGIIYLHRITDNRVAGSALKNLNMFQALCGKTDLSQVVLATSMWDKLNDDASHQKGVKDETDLRTNYWADMLDLGSQTFRHDNTKVSADAIINYILSLPGNMVLKVQREVIDKGLALEDTDAGRILVQDLLAERAKHEREREDWRRSHEEAVRSGNQRLIDTVARKEREHAAKMAQLDQERAKNMAVMQQDFARMQEAGERKYARLIDSLEKQVADKTESHEADLRKMEELQRSFDAQLDDMRKQHDQGWRDAVEGQKRINDAQMDALRTELKIVKAQGVTMKERNEKPALVSVLQAVAGGGLMAAGVYNGSSAMVASGSGMMTSALGSMVS